MRSLIYLLLSLGVAGSMAIWIEPSGQESESSAEVAYDLDWRQDGSILAVAASNHLWLLNSKLQLTSTYVYPLLADGIPHLPRAIEWSPDGSWIAMILQGGWLRVWSYPAGELVFEDRLTEREEPDTIQWHPNQPLLSTYRQVVNVQTGVVEQPFAYDVYWGRSTNDPPLEQRLTGAVFWSPDGHQLIRLISAAGCGPCAEFGVFDADSGALIRNLGSRFNASDDFIWSTDGRYRVRDYVSRNDLLFDSEIERLVYVETGYLQFFRMPALVVANTFEDQDVVNQQVVYPDSITHIDWKPNTPYAVTALNCQGSIFEMDIRDMSIKENVQVFAPYPLYEESPCQSQVLPGYSNP